MKRRFCALILVLLFLPVFCFAADEAQDTTTGNTSQGGDASKQLSPERSLLKTGGTINKELGGALTEYGQQRGGILGVGARISGAIYTSTGSAIEDVADNKKSIGQAHKDTFKAAADAHKKEFSGKKNAQNQTGQTSSGNRNPPSKTTHPESPAKSLVTPQSPPQPEFSTSQPSEENQYIAAIESDDDGLRRSTLMKIHSSQLIYNKNILDAAENVLLARHMEDNGPVFSDSLAWICRVLGDNGETKYLDTLRKVAANGSTWRLRMHAMNSRDKLAKESMPNSGTSEGLEEKLEKLARLHQKGLITTEEYESKKKELIKLL